MAAPYTATSPERSTAEALVARAREVCPHSDATRGNIQVRLTTSSTPATA